MKGKLKTAVIYAVVSVLIFMFCSFFACALEDGGGGSYSLQAEDAFDKTASEVLDNEGMTGFALSDLKDVSFTDILKYIAEKIKEESAAPVKTSALIICVTALFSFAEAFDCRKDAFISGMLPQVICVYALCSAVTDCISSFSHYVLVLNSFLKAVCPAVCVIEAVSGCSGTALAYKLGVTAVSEMLAFMGSDAAVYFVYVYFALCACSALCPFVDLSSLSNSVMKIISTLLGFAGALFTGFLSVKRVFGSVSDTLAVRSLKFAAGSLIPIVGSSVSEGISSVLAGVKTTGSVITAASAAVTAVLGIPLIIRLFMWNFALRIIKGICGMLDTGSSRCIYDGFIDFIKLMTALCFFSLYICCACILMTGINGQNI